MYLLQITLLQTFLDLTVLFGSILSNLICSLKFLFGIFRVALLFICQGSSANLFALLLLLFSDNFDIISCCANFVNNFFKLFQKLFSNLPVDFIHFLLFLFLAATKTLSFSRWIFNIAHPPGNCQQVF